ncbi:hypothetical protein [uncultured Thiodictyon sp.]|uniref:hypothetical protein n=1 Tax=uncultured Thiodictyon sp. TaxID=1846217 RepID=UPI0025EE37B1|nr:hypothetical protein [uncultured Thiodictyon sp.]
MPAPRPLSRLAAALLAALATNVSAATEYAYLDDIAGGWANWSWSTAVTNDTVVKKSGTASARVAITGAWGAFSLNRDAGAVGLGSLSAITFDVNPGAATNVAKVAALVFALQDGNTLGPAVTLGGYASPALAANTWSSVSIPIGALTGSLTAMTRLNLQDGLGGGGITFNLDNLALVAAVAAGACRPVVVDSGIAGAGKSINGFLNDQYTWSDAACRVRNAALARNDTSKGGNAKQFTYTLPNGTTRTVNPAANGAAGFGYVVAHLSNPSFANAYGADDSPLGSGNAATFRKLFTGNHHAIHEYSLNYVRYGLTAAALINHSIDPWTWLTGAADPNRQYVTVYNMPVRIHWMFATGRNSPVWSVTFDLSAAPDHAVDSDFRAPYGDMNIEGGTGANLVAGVAWGDRYRFTTLGSPFTMNNDWDYSQLNTGAPYDALWAAAVDAQMGLAGTQIVARQNAGGYNNYQAPVWRGKTSATMGKLCLNDQGAGPGYNHKLPCSSDWAYQLVQYSVASAAQTTSNKRLAWGADWGSLGNSAFTNSNGYAVSGYPKVSYSVYVVLDPHSANPTQTVAKQAETINLTRLTATLGTVRTQGIAGVGRTDTKPYSPAGYSPIYGTWEVDAAANAVNLTFAVPTTATVALDTPIIVVHGYTKATPPVQVSLDGVGLAADTDYFASVRPDQAELWITLNRKLIGTHGLQIW